LSRSSLGSNCGWRIAYGRSSVQDLPSAISHRLSAISELSNQSFLRHRDDEHAVSRKDAAGGETAPAGRGGRRLDVQQPLIGAKRAMKPNRMIETRHHELAI